MIEDLKNVLLAGIGSAAYTYEKASKLVEELVERGKLTIDEGKELSQELKRNVSEKTDKIRPITKEEMASLLKEMNFATKDEIEDLKDRLLKLEQKNQ